MYHLILLLIMTVLVVLDQLTKLAAVHCLAGAAPVSLWDGVLEFCYSENRGIAWGMLQKSSLGVIFATSLMLAFLLTVLMTGRFRRSRLISLGGALVLAGGVGNLIDRMVNGYVVDFIHYYKWIDFPVFNVADCCVTIGALLILIYFFFCTDKEKDAIKEAAADGTAPAEADGSAGGHTS